MNVNNPKPTEHLSQITQADLMRQLSGNSGWGQNAPMNGIMEMAIGFMQGTLGQQTTNTVGQVSQNQRHQEFMQQYMNRTMSNDKRIPNMLQTIGTAVGGQQAGADFRNTFEGMPPFLKNMVQTMTNQSGLGQLMGGDPTSIAAASMSMLGRENKFTTPSGLGNILGDSTSTARMAMATDINNQLMGHFQDQTTGLENLGRTKGMGFENVGRMVNAMSASGQISANDMVSGIGSGGEVKVDSSKMDSVKKKVSEGMELLRNMADVFGGNEFGELMNQAERVAGLDMEDPSSMKRSLTAIRNARGVAASVGMDERHALGLLAHANDTSVAMGMDRNVASAFNNANFAGAVVQGSRNVSAGNGPFEDSVFRRTQNAEDMMKDRAKMTNFLLQEAEENSGGSLSRAIMLKSFMAKNPEAMQQTITEGPNKGKTLGEAIEEGLADDSENRDETLGNLVSAVQDVTGQDLDQQASTFGLKNQMKLLDRETLDDLASDTMRSEEIARNQRRMESVYMPMEMDGERLAEAVAESDLSDDEKIARLEGMRTVMDMTKRSNEFGGLENLAVMAGVAEGRAGHVLHDGKAIHVSEITDPVERAAMQKEIVAKRMMDTGKFETLAEAEAEADKFIKGVQAMDTMQEDTGVFSNKASVSMSSLQERIGTDPTMSAIRISDQAREDAKEAAEIGGKRFMGATAQMDPLKNFLYGALGEDARSRRESAMERVKAGGGLTVTEMEANALGITQQQRELYSAMQDPDADKEGLSEKQAVQNALTDFQERTMSELEDTKITGKDGKETNLLSFMADNAGLSEEDLEDFKASGVRRAELEAEEKDLKKDLAAAREAKDTDAIATLEEELESNKQAQASETEGQLENFSKLVSPLGAGHGGRPTLLDDLEQQLGVATTVKSKSKEDMQGELDALIKKRDEQQEALDAAGTEEEKEAAKEALALTKGSILKMDKEGDGKLDEGYSEASLELIQNEGTVIDDDDDNAPTAMEMIEDRENFERTLEATQARSFQSVKKNLRVQKRAKEREEKGESKLSDDEISEMLDKEDEARFEELSGKDEKELTAEESRDLKSLKADREISDFLKAGDEDSDMASGDILRERKEFLNTAISDDKDFRSSLQTDEGIKDALSSGLSAREISKSLASVDSELEEQQEGLNKESDAFKDIQKKREEISSARDAVRGHFGDDAGGMLAELVDLMSRVFDGGKPIRVVNIE